MVKSVLRSRNLLSLSYPTASVTDNCEERPTEDASRTRQMLRGYLTPFILRQMVAWCLAAHYCGGRAGRSTLVVTGGQLRLGPGIHTFSLRYVHPAGLQFKHRMLLMSVFIE